MEKSKDITERLHFQYDVMLPLCIRTNFDDFNFKFFVGLIVVLRFFS